MPSNHVFSVSELTGAIKAVLEPPFRAVAVKGEISNFKLQTSGHLYFSLKDAGSQISAVLFKGNAAALARLPKEGDQVVASGELSLYVPRGSYQLVIRELQFLGVGELLLKLHQLKEQLQARGWFDKGRKRALPKLPQRIGVITSPTGAVIQDILHVLTRRFRGFQVILNPVKVQGEGAAEEIARAIYDCNRYRLADVLIVGRGGGSIEDLWAFNEEIVAKAIFESNIPVISAVGHETDFTIADWVADVRAPTPSAAAEIAISEKANLLKFLSQVETVATQRAKQQVGFARQKMQALQRHPLIANPLSLLTNPVQQLDAMQEDLDASLRLQIQNRKSALDSFARGLALLEPSKQILRWKERTAPFKDKIHSAISGQISAKRERLRRIEEHLRSIHPKNLMKKGYSILFSEPGGSILSSATQLTPKQTIRALLSDGSLSATVDSVEHDTRNSLF